MVKKNNFKKEIDALKKLKGSVNHKNKNELLKDVKQKRKQKRYK